MKWIITRDLTELGLEHTAVGQSHSDDLTNSMRTPGGSVNPLVVAQHANSMNFEFRLLDDDGEPMVEGRCVDLDQQDGDSAFEPLDTFESIYGASIMEYRKVGDSLWEVL